MVRHRSLSSDCGVLYVLSHLAVQCALEGWGSPAATVAQYFFVPQPIVRREKWGQGVVSGSHICNPYKAPTSSALQPLPSSQASQKGPFH